MRGAPIFASYTGRAIAGWQNASQSEQNARGSQSTRERVALKIRSEGERETCRSLNPACCWVASKT
jgi:hypothetical protein